MKTGPIMTIISTKTEFEKLKKDKRYTHSYTLFKFQMISIAKSQLPLMLLIMGKGLEKIHIEWTGSKETPQMEWKYKFETHFEWKHVHSLHSL